MVVQGDAGEGAYEDAVLLGARNHVRERRIKGVDTLQHYHVVRAHLEVAVLVFADSGGEIVFRHQHLFARQELQEIFLQGLVVHGVEIVEVVAAVGKLGRVHAVHEIVVRAEGDGPQAAGLELHCEPLRYGGFTGRRRAGDEHQPHSPAAVETLAYLFRYLNDLLFLQGFRYLDEFLAVALLAGEVQVAHGAQAHYIVPGQVLLEHSEGLGLVHVWGDEGGVMLVGAAEQHAFVEELQVPDLKVAGRRHQAAVVIVGGAAEGVVVHIHLPAGFQQTGLVFVAFFPEDAYGLGRLHLEAVEVQVFLHHSEHAGLYLFHVFRGGFAAVGLVQFAVVAVRDWMLHLYLAAAEHVVRRLAQQEEEGTVVHPHSAGGGGVAEFDVAVVIDTELEPLGNVVHLGRNYRVGHVENEGGEHIEQGGSFPETLVCPRVFAVHLYHADKDSIFVLIFFYLCIQITLKPNLCLQMKKYLVVCAAALLLLPCFPLLSQEADEPGPGVEFTVVPRLDVSYEDGGLALGNSSIYSLFEGNIGNSLSFSLCNHWASFGMNGNLPGIHPDWEWNWHRLVDWAYLGYDIGNFNISLGRMMLFGGGMEFDLYDWEVHPILASSLWNNFDIYQEAVSLTWGMEEIGTELSLQMATSPFGDPAHPFADKLYSFGAQWRCDYDFVRNIWSVSYMNTGAGWFPLVSLPSDRDPQPPSRPARN